MVDFDPALRHGLLQITVGNRISGIEKHRLQNDVFRIVVPLKTDHENASKSVIDPFAEYGTSRQTARPMKFCDKAHLFH